MWHQNNSAVSYMQSRTTVCFWGLLLIERFLAKPPTIRDLTTLTHAFMSTQIEQILKFHLLLKQKLPSE